MRKSTRVFLFTLLVWIIPFSVHSQSTVDFQALDQYIDKAVKDFELTGLAISIVKDRDMVFQKGYGLKNANTQEAMTTSALFNIASCSKAITAACIGILVKEGQLNWKDKVIDYIPEFRLSDPYITKELNITDILCHRSGLATFDGDLLWYGTQYDNQEIIKRMRYLPVRNDFRSEYGYQNNMYIIAGEIIYKITGMTWSDFVYNKIFRLLGMTESRTCGIHVTDNQDLAHPHLNGQLRQPQMSKPNPCGSIFSSVEEMSHWMIMLLNGGSWNGQQILDASIIEKLFSAQISLGVSPLLKQNGTHFRAYGLGWRLFDYSGKKIVEHDGGMPGYISKVTLVPEEKLGVVMLTNDMNSLTLPLRLKILDEFLNDSQKDWAKEFLELEKNRKEITEKQKSDRLAKRVKNTSPSLELAKYTGIYHDLMYGDARIEIVNKELNLTLLPAKDLFVSNMEHWHFDTFRIQFKDEFLPEGFVTFFFNSDAEITGFKIDLPNPDFHFYNLDFKKISHGLMK